MSSALAESFWTYCTTAVIARALYGSFPEQGDPKIDPNTVYSPYYVGSAPYNLFVIVSGKCMQGLLGTLVCLSLALNLVGL